MGSMSAAHLEPQPVEAATSEPCGRCSPTDPNKRQRVDHEEAASPGPVGRASDHGTESRRDAAGEASGAGWNRK
eukprot:scaffold19887_cov41-Prasinocladus_malaysianus.AAC.1